MSSRQPFSDRPAVHAAADEIWWSLSVDDWLEAFSSHSRIGDKSGSKWSVDEQSGMRQAQLSTSETMARLNDEYAEKFGFIFIVCASGKSAEEMLRLLELRIHRSREEEIQAAAEEQAEIMHIRLDKLLDE